MSSRSPKKLACKRCAGGELRRLNRVGFMERRVLSALGIFPWECVLCRKKLYRHDDGHVDVAKREAERAAAKLEAEQAAEKAAVRAFRN